MGFLKYQSIEFLRSFQTDSWKFICEGSYKDAYKKDDIIKVL